MKKSRTATCPTCGKPAPIDKINSLVCSDCSHRFGTFSELWIDFKTGGPLSEPDSGDETMCQLRHLIAERFGAIDIESLSKLRDWLVSDCGLTREQVNVLRREKIVELLRTHKAVTSQTPQPSIKAKGVSNRSPSTKQVQIRQQRLSFATPRRAKGQSWQEISDAYNAITKYRESDPKAGADTFRQMFEYHNQE